MSMPEQSGDSFDFCVLFRVYFTGKGALTGLAVVLLRHRQTRNFFQLVPQRFLFRSIACDTLFQTFDLLNELISLFCIDAHRKITTFHFFVLSRQSRVAEAHLL